MKYCHLVVSDTSPFINCTCRCHENTLICLDELYAHVIPAQAGIQDDRSPGSYFRSTDRQSRCEHATFSSSVVPLASGMLDCEPSRSSEPKAKRKQSHTSAFPPCS